MLCQVLLEVKKFRQEGAKNGTQKWLSTFTRNDVICWRSTCIRTLNELPGGTTVRLLLCWDSLWAGDSSTPHAKDSPRE